MIGNKTSIEDQADVSLPSSFMGKIRMSNYVVYLYDTDGENDGTKMFLLEDD